MAKLKPISQAMVVLLAMSVAQGCATITTRKARAVQADSVEEWSALWTRTGVKSPEELERRLAGATELARNRLSKLHAALDARDVPAARRRLHDLEECLRSCAALDPAMIVEIERRLGKVRLDSAYLEGTIVCVEARVLVDGSAPLDGLALLKPYASQEQQWDQEYQRLVALDLERVAEKTTELINAGKLEAAPKPLVHAWEVLKFDDGHSAKAFPEVGLGRLPFHTWLTQTTTFVRETLERRATEQYTRHNYVDARGSCVAALSVAFDRDQARLQSWLESRIIVEGVKHYWAQAERSLASRQCQPGLEQLTLAQSLDPDLDVSRLSAKLNLCADDQRGKARLKEGRAFEAARRYPDAVYAYRAAQPLLIDKSEALAGEARAKRLAMRKIAILPVDDQTEQYSGRTSIALLTLFQGEFLARLSEFHTIVPARRVREEIFREFRWNHLDLNDREVRRLFMQRLGADYVVDIRTSNYSESHSWSGGERHSAATRSYLGRFVETTYNCCGLILSQRLVDRYRYEPASYTTYTGSADTSMSVAAALYSVEEPGVVSQSTKDLSRGGLKTRAESNVDPSNLFQPPATMGETEERTSPIEARMFNVTEYDLYYGPSALTEKLNQFLVDSAKQFAAALGPSTSSGAVAKARASSNQQD